MIKYSVFMQYDDIDKIYVASIPELQGCMAHGNTPEEAFKEIGTVCNMWLETAKEKGLTIPEPHLYNTYAR